MSGRLTFRLARPLARRGAGPTVALSAAFLAGSCLVGLPQAWGQAGALPPSLAPLNTVPGPRQTQPPMDAGPGQGAQQPRPLQSGPPPLPAPTPLFTLSEDGKPSTRPGPGGEPDLSALRYYVQSKQKDRADAEIARLQRLYPGWKPPTDVWQAGEINTVDEEPLWDLYTADRIPELRQAIRAKMTADPGWQPSRDLMSKLRRKELRLVVERMAKDGQQKQIVQYVRQSGISPNDIDVDILWVIAEAQAKAGLQADALNTYQAILNTDNVSQERLATIQKAMGVLPMSEVDKLIATARTVSGRNEFSSIATDITRARISAYLKEERSGDIDPNEMRAFEDYARSVGDANQKSLIAWYYYNHRDYPQALSWFKASIDKGGDAMVAHGLALTLLNLKMYREAEEVAYAWRNALINNMILYVDILERDLTNPVPPFIEPDRLSRYGQVAMETTSGEAAQGLAWYAYNSCQYDVALQWFERAMAWFPKSATAYGYANTLERLKRRQDEMVIVNRYDGLFAQVVEIVFPDGIVRPPSICDQRDAELRERRTAGNRRTGGGDAAAASYQAPQQTPQQRPVPVGARDTRVPSPTSIGPGGQAFGDGSPMPKLDRNEFPISVDPANPLRFAAVGRSGGGVDGSTAASSSPYQGGTVRFAQEPFRGPWPLVARRVPGVGPMPYERYGFSLLPAWNGQTDATTPPYSAQPAPTGTLWAQRPAEQAVAGR